jgi:hypothetical protein
MQHAPHLEQTFSVISLQPHPNKYEGFVLPIQQFVPLLFFGHMLGIFYRQL